MSCNRSKYVCTRSISRGRICIYFRLFLFNDDRRSNFLNSHGSQKFQKMFTYCHIFLDFKTFTNFRYYLKNTQIFGIFLKRTYFRNISTIRCGMKFFCLKKLEYNKFRILNSNIYILWEFLFLCCFILIPCIFWHFS